MRKEDVLTQFKAILRDEPNMSAAVAAVKILSHYIQQSDAGTLQELTRDMKEVTEILMASNVAAVSVESGCELFLRFITLTSLDNPDIDQCKKKLLERGAMFMKFASHSRSTIAEKGVNFLRDNAVILTHSYSRVVLTLIVKAAAMNRRFVIYITESQPDKSGYRMRDKLRENGIRAEVIVDAAIGYIMNKIDLVIVGAEGVAASGGIINKIGTYPMAVMAKACQKPFYCVAESFKFVRLYPLCQEDIPTTPAQRAQVIGIQDRERERDDSSSASAATTNSAPATVETGVDGGGDGGDGNLSPGIGADYTPPEYITLLFTDLGVLTPSAVSDELIKLYL